MSEMSRQFSLRHIKHETKMNNCLYSMLLEQNLVDVILTCDGTNIKAHRLILSANSSYFKSLFDSLESNRCQIPIIVLKDVPLVDIKAIIEFMYRGEVCVEEKQLSSVLKSAELLKVFGLTEVCLALRSRINSESVEDKSKPASGPSGQKRPRISEGVKQTIQQTNELFSNLSNARFEIRPTHSPHISPNIQTNGQNLQTTVSTAITSKAPTIVKNVILPSNQIHKKNVSNVQNVPKVTIHSTTGPNIQLITASSSVQNSPTQKSVSNAIQTPCVQTISLKQVLSSTTTPTIQTLTPTAVHLTPSYQNQSERPIEVLIDDETPEPVFTEELDIKPQIFELPINENQKEVPIPNVDNQSSKKNSETDVKAIKQKSTEKSKTETTVASTRTTRTYSTCSQSSLTPPPPTYRVVQRSSSRLLRNIIKPTACVSSSASTSTPKTKDSEEKAKTNSRKTIRIIKPNISKSDVDLGSAYGESSPEIECPSCGEKFSDEKTWNEHISSLHLPLQT